MDWVDSIHSSHRLHFMNHTEMILVNCDSVFWSQRDDISEKQLQLWFSIKNIFVVSWKSYLEIHYTIFKNQDRHHPWRFVNCYREYWTSQSKQLRICTLPVFQVVPITTNSHINMCLTAGRHVIDEICVLKYLKISTYWYPTNKWTDVWF